MTLGDWRNNKDEEVELDGIGGVNILVKADVHRSGKRNELANYSSMILMHYHRHQLPMLLLRKPGRNRRIR